ncbi:MAG: hypothetical protein QF745_06035, partial [Planctomycetota bacterium]|nr:hypothetical protein [Planctomycetota bacterium]
MNSIRKCLLHGVLPAMLASFPQLLSAEQYTASELELRSGWRFEFKNGSHLSFHRESEALEL